MRITQAEFSRKFDETHREEFNPDLFKRDNQELVDSIRQVVESIERDKYFTLKLLSFDVIYNYEEIYDVLRANEEVRKRKNVDNQYNYINIKDSDIILCKVRWYVCHNGIERVELEDRTVQVINPNQELEVLIALPRFVKGYYFRLNGNYYSTAFQIVDGSTYNNNNTSNSKSDTVTLKTMFMPIRIFRSLKNVTDVRTKTSIKAIEYNSNIFNNTVNAMYYLLAHFGLYGTSDFLDIHCVSLSMQPNLHEDYICFEKHGIYISCHREYFKDAMVQSYMCTLYDGIFKDTTINDLFDQRYWLRVLGLCYKNASIEKGLFVLDSIDGIYDNITKRDLRLPDEDKENIYTITRWLLREFSALKMKENVDVRTKRIRLADYISAVYATKLNQGMYRISDMGKKVTLKKVIQAINISPMYILNNISTMSNLIAYRDLVNDGDALTALKFTYKGISGLGESGGSVQKIYRYVDPSYLGILDLTTSSNSDPGMSGMICPLTSLYNDHSFSEYSEPNTWRENYEPLHQDKSLLKPNAISPISFRDPSMNTGIPYDTYRAQIEKEELQITKVTCPLRSIIDPKISFGSDTINATKTSVPMKSLFTVISDEDEDVEEENPNKTLYLDDFDDGSDD